MKKLILLVLVISISLVFCSNNTSPNYSGIEKIIVLSPEIGEIICSLDGEDKIKAVIQECDYPPLLKDKPKIGSFSSPDIERIISLEPDLVILSGLEQEVVKTRLKNLNIRVCQFFPNSVDSLLNTIEKVGEIVNNKGGADSLINYFYKEINQLVLPSNKPNVYFEVYKNPLMTVSDDSFVGDVIETSGGNNIFSNLPRNYCRISPEKIVEANPDIMIISYPGSDKQQIKSRLGWEEINAIAYNRIYTESDIKMETIVRAGPRTIQGIITLNSIFNEFKNDEQ